MVIQRTIIHLYTILALIQVFATSQLLIANNIYKIGVNYVDRGGGVVPNCIHMHTFFVQKNKLYVFSFMTVCGFTA